MLVPYASFIISFQLSAIKENHPGQYKMDIVTGEIV